ncbi:unnamed protein product [Mucor hiemalis]
MISSQPFVKPLVKLVCQFNAARYGTLAQALPIRTTANGAQRQSAFRPLTPLQPLQPLQQKQQQQQTQKTPSGRSRRDEESALALLLLSMNKAKCTTVVVSTIFYPISTDLVISSWKWTQQLNPTQSVVFLIKKPCLKEKKPVKRRSKQHQNLS